MGQTRELDYVRCYSMSGYHMQIREVLLFEELILYNAVNRVFGGASSRASEE